MSSNHDSQNGLFVAPPEHTGASLTFQKSTQVKDKHILPLSDPFDLLDHSDSNHDAHKIAMETNMYIHHLTSSNSRLRHVTECADLLHYQIPFPPYHPSLSMACTSDDNTSRWYNDSGTSSAQVFGSNGMDVARGSGTCSETNVMRSSRILEQSDR